LPSVSVTGWVSARSAACRRSAGTRGPSWPRSIEVVTPSDLLAMLSRNTCACMRVVWFGAVFFFLNMPAFGTNTRPFFRHTWSGSLEAHTHARAHTMDTNARSLTLSHAHALFHIHTRTDGLRPQKQHVSLKVHNMPSRNHTVFAERHKHRRTQTLTALVFACFLRRSATLASDKSNVAGS
jgi:hypothetical protein